MENKPPLFVHLFSAPLTTPNKTKSPNKLIDESKDNESDILSLELQSIRDELDYINERKKLKKCFKEANIGILFYSEVCTVHNFMKACSAARVLHITGHGMPGAVVFEKEGDGVMQLVDENELRHMLQASDMHHTDQNSLRLVFVSTCYSESIANAFVNAGVAHVVAVNHSEKVLDSASLEFAHTFYTALLRGDPVQSSFSQGKQRVAMSSDHSEESNKFLLLGDGDHNERIYSNNNIYSINVFQDITSPLPNSQCDSVVDFFLGRNTEVQQIISNINNGVRLISLNGTHGIGKTQIALKACEYARERYLVDEIYFIDFFDETLQLSTSSSPLSSPSPSLLRTSPLLKSMGSPSQRRVLSPHHFASTTSMHLNNKLSINDLLDLLLKIFNIGDNIPFNRGNEFINMSPPPIRPTLRASMSLSMSNNSSREAQIIELIRDKLSDSNQVLLLLDACDNILIEDLSRVLKRLIKRVPQIHIITTSELPLKGGGLESIGERILTISPLDNYSMAELFTKRAPRELTFNEMYGGTMTDFGNPIEAFSQSTIIQSLEGNPGALVQFVPCLTEKKLLLDETEIIETLIPIALRKAKNPFLREMLNSSSNLDDNEELITTIPSINVPEHPNFDALFKKVNKKNNNNIEKIDDIDLNKLNEKFNNLGHQVYGLEYRDSPINSLISLDESSDNFWETLCKLNSELSTRKSDSLYSDNIHWPILAGQLSIYFSEKLPFASRNRPITQEFTDYLACDQKLWGKGSSPEAQGGIVFEHQFVNRFWKWWLGFIRCLQIVRVWGVTQPTKIVYGLISGKRTQELLNGKDIGTFILRFSVSRICTLVVCYVMQNYQINNVLVTVNESGVSISLGRENRSYATLDELICSIDELKYLYPNIPKNRIFMN